MSRLGEMPIEIPKGVDCQINGKNVSVKGPKGNLKLEIKKDILVVKDQEQLLVSLGKTKDEGTKFQGLYRTLIFNMVEGVTKGFEKKLELKGVGYRAAVQGTKLNMQLGFSHPTVFDIPSGLDVKVENNTLVTISGADKQLVGQFAAELHHMRKPEPYKGKGVHYLGQYVRRKAGKAGSKK
tara:strand:- start:252 stop:794 length:543 start_codon:yes stop_codon:yes gene_type:complete